MAFLAFVLALVTMSACGGAAAAPANPVSPAQASPGMPAQPAPAGPDQFSMFGFTWQMHTGGAPGGGTFLKDNVAVEADAIVLTLNTDGAGTSTGAEIATLTPLGYGTYTFRYKQDVVQSGSIAAGFSYLTNSATEIDVEQQGQYPQRWDFTNWTGTSARDSGSVEGYDASQYHILTYRWTARDVTWFIDGAQVAQHTQDVPAQPAPFLFNYWGTNSSNWGGSATAGTRHMSIVAFSYQPE